MMSTRLRHITFPKRRNANTPLNASAPLTTLGALIVAIAVVAISVTLPKFDATAQSRPGPPTSLTSESFDQGAYIEWRKSDGGPSIACYYVRWRVAAHQGNPAGAWQPGEDGRIARTISTQIDGLEIGTTYDIQVRSYSEVADAHSEWASISHTMHRASEDASLRSLTLSQGTLTPAFSPSRYGEDSTYNATVPNSVTSVTITPTANHSAATITLRGAPITSGVASDPISLLPGDNMIDVWVQAEITGIRRPYVVNVNRAPSNSQLAAPTDLTLIQDALDLKHYITLSWTAPSGATSAVLEYRKEELLGIASSWQTTGVTDLTVSGGKIHTFLSPNTLYDVRVAVTDSSNTIGEYATVRFRAASPPPYLYEFTVTPGEESLNVSWLDPDNDSIENYNVRWREIHDHPCCPWNEKTSGRTIGAENANYTITGLTAGQLYEVQVRGVNNLGPGAWSPSVWYPTATGTPLQSTSNPQQQILQEPKVIEVTPTPTEKNSQPQIIAQADQTPTAPGPVQNLQLDARGKKIVVTWEPPATGDSPTRYNVTLRDTDGGKPQVRRPGPKKLKIVFRNLKAGKTYEISVSAKNAAGQSELSTSTVTLD